MLTVANRLSYLIGQFKTAEADADDSILAQSRKALISLEDFLNKNSPIKIELLIAESTAHSFVFNVYFNSKQNDPALDYGAPWSPNLHLHKYTVLPTFDESKFLFDVEIESPAHDYYACQNCASLSSLLMIKLDSKEFHKDIDILYSKFNAPINYYITYTSKE